MEVFPPKVPARRGHWSRGKCYIYGVRRYLHQGWVERVAVDRYVGTRYIPWLLHGVRVTPLCPDEKLPQIREAIAASLDDPRMDGQWSAVGWTLRHLTTVWYYAYRGWFGRIGLHNL